MHLSLTQFEEYTSGDGIREFGRSRPCLLIVPCDAGGQLGDAEEARLTQVAAGALEFLHHRAWAPGSRFLIHLRGPTRTRAVACTIARCGMDASERLYRVGARIDPGPARNS
jgi:hypothetical protein